MIRENKMSNVAFLRSGRIELLPGRIFDCLFMALSFFLA
jgi:hypothetical protein